jgi:outer membrane receptor protein involved in Fe transport
MALTAIARGSKIMAALVTTDRRPRMRSRISPITIGVLASLYGLPAFADDTTLQEVIVTATRRSESAQDIPASITAITGSVLEQAGIADTNGLAHSLLPPMWMTHRYS